MLVTVRDTSCPSAPPGPTRCRPEQWYCGLSLTGHLPSTVGPPHSASTSSVTGSSITNDRSLSMVGAWPRADGSASAERRQCGGTFGGSSSPGDGDVLALHELEEAVVAPLPTEPALLDPAERRRRVRHDGTVEADHARLERLAESQPPLQIAGVHVGDEPVFRVVRQRHRLLLAVEDDHRGDRSKDLLAQDRRVGGHVDEHRGRVEEAGTVRNRAADGNASAVPERTGNKGFDLVATRGIDERPELHAVVEPRAHSERTHGRGEARAELRRDATLHQETVGRGARLAAVAHLRDHGARRGALQIGVVKDDERRVATELHRAVHDAVGGLMQQTAPDLGGPGERELAHPWVP